MSFPKTIPAPVVEGTVDSFNHEGKGKQSFDNSKIKSGAMIHKSNRGSLPSIGGTLSSFNSVGDGDQSFVGADIQCGVQEVNEKVEDGTKDLWAQLEKIGLEDNTLSAVYLYLFNNPRALQAFNGVPIDKRKQILPQIVPNYPLTGFDRNLQLA